MERESTKGVKSKNVAEYSRKRLKHRPIVSTAAGIFVIPIRMASTLSYGIKFGESLESGLGVFVVIAVVELIIRFWRSVSKTSCYVLDQQSENDLALWQAFGWFLNDSTTFKDKELPEFPIWRGCMICAVAMGKGQTVARALALKYPETSAAGISASDDDWYRWMRETIFYDAMDSAGREVVEVREPRSSGGGNDND